MKKPLFALSLLAAFALGFAHNAQAKFGYVTDGLVAHWDAIDNQNTGSHSSSATTWVDLVSGVSATLSGYTWLGDALLLNGSGGGIADSTLLDWAGTANSNRTIEVVFQYNSASDSGVLLTGSLTSGIGVGRVVNAKGRYFIPNVGSANKPVMMSESATAMDAMSVGYQAGVVSTTNLYENGAAKTLTSSITTVWSQNPGTGKIYIGKRGSSYGSYLKGRIYSVRIYDRLLTPEEVAANYAIDTTRFVTAETTYVAPAGTAGNTPTVPFSSWATAANNILDASSVTESDGLVKIASGNYSANYSVFAVQHEPVAFEAVDPDTGAAGDVTIGSKFLNYSGLCPAAGKNTITLQKGTFRMSGTGFFYVDSTGSGYASNTVVVTGADTKLVTLGQEFYIGSGAKGSCLKYTDHAVGEHSALCAPYNFAASDAMLIVENGACVTNGSGKQAYIGYNGPAGHVIVSNGTLCLRGQTLIGRNKVNEGYVGSTLYVGGATPNFNCTVQCKFLGDTKTTIDVAEAPLGGYAVTPINVAEFTCSTNATFHVIGLDKLEARLIAAGTAKGAQWQILNGSYFGTDSGAPSREYTTTHIALQAKALADEVKAANPHFSLKRTGTTSCQFILVYEGQDATYVVPEGTAGNTPAAPYITWETAANHLNEAANTVVAGGTITVVSGNYTNSEMKARVLANNSAIYKIVTSSEDPTPGTIIVTNCFFASGLANPDGLLYNATFTCGTVKMLPNASSQCFLEYMIGGSWGADSRCQVTFTGANTIYDISKYALYCGYTTRNSILRFSDHAQGLISTLNVGALSNARGSQVIVESDAECKVSGSLSLGTVFKDCKLTVDDGLVTAANMYFDRTTPTFNGGKGAQDQWATNDTKIVITGSHPQLKATYGIDFSGNAEVIYDLAEVATAGYAVTPVKAGRVNFYAASTLSLTGVDAFKATYAAAGHQGVKITLAEASEAAKLNLSDEKLAAINETLPTDCTLSKRGAKLMLQVGASEGFLIMVQ